MEEELREFTERLYWCITCARKEGKQQLAKKLSAILRAHTALTEEDYRFLETVEDEEMP